MTDLIKESLYLFPDSILFGSIFVGLTTLSKQHILFFLSCLVSLGSLFGIQNITSFLYGSSLSPIKCKPTLFKYTFEQLFLRPSANSPSYGMFLVSFATTYLATSLYMLKDELDVLDLSNAKQYYISISLLVLLSIVYLMIRLTNECETSGSAISGLFFGSLIGALLVNLNVQLFGKDSINFLGIPLLRNRTADGKPIYICSN